VFDESFINRFKAGDTNLFDSLNADFHSWTMKKLRSTGRSSIAEDAYNTAWCAFVEGRKNVDFARCENRTSLRWYFFSIASRSATKLQDAEYAARGVSIELADTNPKQPSSPSLSDAQRQQFELIKSKLTELNDLERQLVEARFSLDPSVEYARIAREHNIPRGAVRNRAYRAVEKLRRIVEQEGQ